MESHHIGVDPAAEGDSLLEHSFHAANNYASSLSDLGRFEEAKALLRKLIPIARRVLGDGHDLTLLMSCGYADALYMDAGASLDDLHEAVTTLEDGERIARRVFGSAHPHTAMCGERLRHARAVLRAREAGKRVVFEYK